MDVMVAAYMRLSKRMKMILGCLGVIMAFQLASYFALSSTCIPSLALNLTPEHTHFAKDPSFSWVLLELDYCKNLTASQKDKLLLLLRERYGTVYLSKDDVPVTEVDRNPEGWVVGYNRGFSYNFSVVSSGPFWVRVSHGDYEANLAASYGEDVYVWFLGVWVKVYHEPLTVA